MTELNKMDLTWVKAVQSHWIVDALHVCPTWDEECYV